MSQNQNGTVSSGVPMGGVPEFTTIDTISIGVYFAVLFIIGLVVSRKQRKNEEHHGASSTSYFLAERSVSFWAVGASLFASNIGSEHFVGLAGSGASGGIAVGWYEWGAIPPLLLLGYFFLPLYYKAGTVTLPDYLEMRYNGKARTVVVTLSLVLYIFTKIAATLYAGQLILSELSHLNRWIAVVLLIVATALYTITGGLAAVIYTEVLQTCVLLVGGLLLLGFGLSEVGGFSQLQQELPASFFHLMQPSDHESFPWSGFMFGYPVIGLWYWTTDQVIVQRTLAAKDVAHAKAGCVMASFLKICPVFIMVFPGMIARVLMERDDIVDDNGISVADPNVDPMVFDRSFPWLIKRVMPPNTLGILVAAMLASLMSSLSSVFNSAATLFTINIYAVHRPDASQKTLVWVGRVTVVVLALLSLLWLPIIPLLGDQLFINIQKPAAYTCPSVLTLFLLGMLFKRPHSKGALPTLAFGITFGMFRFLLELIQALSDDVFAGTIVESFLAIHFLNFCAISFILCCIVLVTTSSMSSSCNASRTPRRTRSARRSSLGEELADDETASPHKLSAGRLARLMIHKSDFSRIMDGTITRGPASLSGDVYGDPLDSSILSAENLDDANATGEAVELDGGRIDSSIDSCDDDSGSPGSVVVVSAGGKPWRYWNRWVDMGSAVAMTLFFFLWFYFW